MALGDPPLDCHDKHSHRLPGFRITSETSTRGGCVVKSCWRKVSKHRKHQDMKAGRWPNLDIYFLGWGWGTSSIFHVHFGENKMISDFFVLSQVDNNVLMHFTFLFYLYESKKSNRTFQFKCERCERWKTNIPPIFVVSLDQFDGFFQRLQNMEAFMLRNDANYIQLLYYQNKFGWFIWNTGWIQVRIFRVIFDL